MKMTVFSYFSSVMANLAILSTDMLWESCLKFNLEQLSHSMFVTNIAILLDIWKKTHENSYSRPFFLETVGTIFF